MRKITARTLALLPPLFFSFNLLADSCLPNAIYLVRHAEKQEIPRERDPGLSPQGVKRAQSLSEQFKSIRLNKIFASEFKRTQQTVAMTAKNQKLKVLVRDARAVQVLAEEILSSCNKNILVAAHSNTVPQLLLAFGLRFKLSVGGQKLRFDPVIYLNDKEDYGSLFKISFNNDNQPQLKLSTF